MEDFIAKIIQADMEAQSQLKSRDEWKLNNTNKIQEAKEKIYQSSWSEAKEFVEKTRKELEEQVKKGNQQAEFEFQANVSALKQKFSEQEDNWRKQIFERCLGR